MLGLSLTMYLKEKVVKPIRTVSVRTKRLCTPSSYEHLDEYLQEDKEYVFVKKETYDGYSEYSEPPSPNYSILTAAGNPPNKMDLESVDLENVWGGDIADTDVWVTGSGSSGGAPVDADASDKEPSWLLAGETVQDAGNRRKLPKAKRAPKTSEPARDTGEIHPLRCHPWAGAGHSSPVQVPSPETESPPNEQTRDPSPQLSASPVEEEDDAQSRDRQVSRWVNDMRRQQRGLRRLEPSPMRIGMRRGEEAKSDGTADEFEWPTLLKDPAKNNHNLPAMEPTGELHQMRMRILLNFGRRCREAGHLASAGLVGGDEPVAKCHLCAEADDFTMLPQHGRLFLDSVLLPLSKNITYAEMALHVNTCVIERLFAESGLGRSQARGKRAWDSLRTTPVYEDYRQALVLATHRRRVLEELPIRVGKFGMVERKK